MRKIIMLALLSAIMLSSCALTPKKVVGLNNLAGTYVGELNSINMVSHKTEFFVDANGIQTGKYFFTEGDGTQTKGTLDKFSMDDPHTLLVVWHDSYGNGVLKMKFSEDFSSFKGKWLPENFSLNIDQYGMRWDGVKQ